MTGTTTDETKTYRRGVSARAGCTVSEHRGQILRPTDAAIEPGSTITWTNNGALPHAVTADDGSFDSGRLNPGDSYTVAFDGQGTVTYFCAVHPEMRGSATVGVGGGGGGTAPAEQPSSEDMSEAKDTRDSYCKLLTFSWYLLSGGAKALALFHGLVTSEFPRRLSFSAFWWIRTSVSKERQN